MSTIIASHALFACSNSDFIGNVQRNNTDECTKNTGTFEKTNILPINDIEYPYAGISRIVIETENRKPIKDKINPVPAKLQVWGKNAPESAVLDLTIRGRGNTSWAIMPKKSYKIEFISKQSMLGMPSDRDWALIANYADKTLIKNFLMFNISAKLGAYYTPKSKFVELYLNEEYLGVYLLTETIKIAKHRINQPKNENSYLVEIDSKYEKNEQLFFSHTIRSDSIGKPFNIHYPQNVSEQSLNNIKTFIQAFETHLKAIPSKGINIEQWIDINEYIKYYWVQEFSKNPDANFYTSVFFTWTKDDVIKMGPVWDFDLSCDGYDNQDINHAHGWHIKYFYWNAYLFNDPNFTNSISSFWKNNYKVFQSTISDIDSIASVITQAASNNFKKWNILESTEFRYHPYGYSSYDDALNHLKNWISKRIVWINKQYH